MLISVVVVRGILAELRNRSIEPEDVLREVELSPECVADLHCYLTHTELERLVNHALERTKDPGLGLAIGAHAPETMLQILGHLLLAHSTIREAFAAWQRYSVLLSDALRFALLERGPLGMVTCEPCAGTVASARFFMDLTLTLTMRIGAHFARGGSDLHAVHFQHAAPGYAVRYRDVFACPVKFGQKQNALIFPRELLDRPQLHADETARTLLREAVERLLRERTEPRTLADRVRNMLQNPQVLAKADAETIARRLAMKPRTLRRRLGVEGTSFAVLVDEARCRVACNALSRPDASVKQIAELLDFSEPSAFHRAFKRWTGCTPAEYARSQATERRASSHRQ